MALLHGGIDTLIVLMLLYGAVPLGAAALILWLLPRYSKPAKWSILLAIVATYAAMSAVWFVSSSMPALAVYGAPAVAGLVAALVLRNK